MPKIPKRGDRVAVIRHRHGWEDGRVTGEIISDPDSKGACLVRPDHDPESELEIKHRRDIRLLP